MSTLSKKSYSNYQKASEELGTKPQKKIANNTWLVRVSEMEVAIKLHSTNIITYHAANPNVVKLSLGGWEESPTTQKRVNLHLPYCEKGRLCNRQGIARWTNGETYEDGEYSFL